MDDSHKCSLVAAQQTLASSPHPAVLFVGNSFSKDIPPVFSRIAAAEGTQFRTDKSTHNGWTLAQHANCPKTFEKIPAGSWDVVVLQEQSRMPARSGLLRRMNMRPTLSKLAREARAAGAIPVLIPTWGYRHGDDKKPGDTFHHMSKRLRLGIREDAIPLGLPIIPGVDVWQQAYDPGEADLLFQPDGKHPCLQGNHATAWTVFNTLFPRTKPSNTSVQTAVSETSRASLDTAFATSRGSQPNRRNPGMARLMGHRRISCAVPNTREISHARSSGSKICAARESTCVACKDAFFLACNQSL